MKNRINLKRFGWTVFAIFIIGIAAAFNASAGLGNGTVGVFYDGIRCVMNLEPEQLGTAANVVNVLMIILLAVVERHYVNLGTILYMLQYGICVNLGTFLYSKIFVSDALVVRIFASGIGCFLLFAGIAIYVVTDIGLEPTTGLTLVIREKLGCEYKQAKWNFDGLSKVIGFLCGGKVGAITVINLIIGGPIIQWMIGKARILLKDITE